MPFSRSRNDLQLSPLWNHHKNFDQMIVNNSSISSTSQKRNFFFHHLIHKIPMTISLTRDYHDRCPMMAEHMTENFNHAKRINCSYFAFQAVQLRFVPIRS